MPTGRPRPRGAACGSELQGLDGEELLDAEAAQFPAVAGLLEAAERRERVEHAAVDLHLTRADPAGDRLGALLVAGPHAAGEAVLGVVGDPDRVLLVVVG